MPDTEIPQDVLDALNKHFDLIGVTTKIPSVLAYEVWNIIVSSRAPDPSREMLVEAFGDPQMRTYSVAELLVELEREKADAQYCDLENTANMFQACIDAIKKGPPPS